jgi:hypothetical protein
MPPPLVNRGFSLLTSSFCYVAGPHQYQPRNSFPRNDSVGINPELCHIRCNKLVHHHFGRHPDMVRACFAALASSPLPRLCSRQYWQAIRNNRRSSLSLKIIILLVESGAVYFALGVRFPLQISLASVCQF